MAIHDSNASTRGGKSPICRRLRGLRQVILRGWDTHGLPSERHCRYEARCHRLGVRSELRKRLEEVLTIGFARPESPAVRIQNRGGRVGYRLICHMRPPGDVSHFDPI